MDRFPAKSQDSLVQTALMNIFGLLYYFALLLVLGALILYRSEGNLLLQSYSVAAMIATTVGFLLTTTLNTSLLNIVDARSSAKEICDKALFSREEEE